MPAIDRHTDGSPLPPKGGPSQIVCADIGSTHTKAALLELAGPASRLLARASVPTTQQDLSQGLIRTLAALTGRPWLHRLEEWPNDIPVRCSSSAKGGLAIAAVGLVPDLTLKLARMAAMSAGGNVIGSYAFALTRADVRRLEQQPPDMILLCGGTDGGNTGYALRNATALAESELDVPLLYAGNRTAADEVARRLQHKDLTVSENLMPDIHSVNLEPAREKIREIFLNRLVAGKGLSHIVKQLGATPRPTPLGLLELVKALPQVHPAWSPFVLVDLGGATTDVYSYAPATTSAEPVVLKGVREPMAKRTVEGDLGLRVSAPALLANHRDLVLEQLAPHGMDDAVLNDFMVRIAREPGRISRQPPDGVIDRVLAATCVGLALRRHAGRVREACTPQGRVQIQKGKDLRGVPALVGSGGYLSACENDDWLRPALACARREESDHFALVPQAPSFYVDRDYRLPLLGNLLPDYTEEAAWLAGASLEKRASAAHGATPS